MEFLFFMAFAFILLGMYIAIRRQLAAPGLIAGMGTIGSIIMMVLFMLSRDTSPIQGIIMGVFAGGLFAIITLVIAWYFQSNEMRAEYAGKQPVEEYYE